MKTAALLPTPGDPFLVRHWLVNCERVWRGDVDEVRVLVTGQPVREAADYIREHVEAIGGIYTERSTGGMVPHGIALNILISDTDADAVVLLEDDVRVRRSGKIRSYLRGIEDGNWDVAMSPRVSMTPGIEQAARERWVTPKLPDDCDGHGAWPAFVFARRTDLLATDRDFGERAWGGGMTVPGLGFYVQPGKTECADTFGGAAFQLRDRCRVQDIPQWKGPWLWPEWLAREMNMAWFHVGSLSSSSNLGADWDGPGRGFEFSDARTLDDYFEIGEWAHRLHWWKRCVDLYGHELPAHAERYLANWERLRERMGVPHDRIEGWRTTVDQMITWDEAP